MDVTETKEELAKITLRILPQLIELPDIHTASYLFFTGYNAKVAEIWQRVRYGAMTAYAAGYIAGIRAERRKKKKKAAQCRKIHQAATVFGKT